VRKLANGEGKEVQYPSPKNSESEPQEVEVPSQEAKNPRPNIPLVSIDVDFTQLPPTALFDFGIEPV
jgi:hypothetical protein